MGILVYVNDPDIVKYTLNLPHPYTKKDGIIFVNKSFKEWREGKTYHFGIELNKEIVGICGLAKVDKNNRSATLGYWLGKKFWGQKIVSKAAAAVVKFAFENLHLHSLNVSHFEENIPSQKIIQKLGFKSEGVEREKYYRFGRWHNHLVYSMLEKEYKQKNIKLQNSK